MARNIKDFANPVKGTFNVGNNEFGPSDRPPKNKELKFTNRYNSTKQLQKSRRFKNAT